MAFYFPLLLVFTLLTTNPNPATTFVVPDRVSIKTGAEQTDQYLPYLKGKRVAILANQTSVIGRTHLVDSLQTLGVSIVKVFGPEHGFRGNASAGIAVA
ncbi:MAG TPA: exo-beta-N-acetylmuramidase NamZ domain-containing protein, partial [Chryseosolibacter sp.]